MEKEREALLNFINLHAHKASIDKVNRCVYITKFHESGIKLDVVLDKLSQDDILRKFNKNSTLVHWVLNQLNTYNQDKEVIIGLEFSNEVLLTHVIKLEMDDD